MKTAALLLAIALPLAPGITHAREHASLGFAWERNRAGTVVTIAW